jgi:hypothetical protein
MTMSLIKIEMAEAILKLKLSQNARSSLSVEEIEALVRDKTCRYENTYLNYLNRPSHLHHLCYLETRLIIAKLWKMAYDPFQRNDPAEGEEIKGRLLLYNTQVL